MATVQAQDIVAVRSRVSWGALVAGAVTALAVHLLLSTLGVALGITAYGQVDQTTLGMGALIWGVGITLFALFIGGYVTSQCSVGENRQEAVIYGVIVWSLVFALFSAMMMSGARMGYHAMMGVGSQREGAMGYRMTEEEMRRAGFNQDQINLLQGRTANLPAEMRDIANPSNTTAAAWWTFFGVLLSMGAAVAGAVAGSGPTWVLRGPIMRRMVVHGTTTSEAARP